MRKLTQEEVEYRINKISDGNISIIGKYTNSGKPIDCKCLICQHKWSPVYGSLGQGFGCPSCAGHILLTQETVEKTINEISGGMIHVLGRYSNSKSPLLCECMVCHHQWSPAYSSLKQGSGCPDCARNIPLTQVIVEQNINNFSDGKIKVIGEYITALSPLPCQCLTCNHKWFPKYGNIQQGAGCPNCNKLQSKGSQKVEKWLIDRDLLFEKEKGFDGLFHKQPLFYDFYIPYYDVVIEYDGRQHFDYIPTFFHKKGYWQFEEQQHRDNLKTKYACDNNIILIRVKYDISLDSVWEYLNEQFDVILRFDNVDI